MSSLVITLLLNTRFFGEIFQAYNWSEDSFFMLSLIPALFALTLTAMSIFSLFIPVKAVVTVFIIIAIPVAYFSSQMGIVFDRELFLSMLETDAHEARDVLPLPLLVTLLLWCILPTVLIWTKPIQREKTAWQRIRALSLTIIACVIFLGADFLANSANYITFIREHKPIRYRMNPVYPIYSFGAFLLDSIHVDDKNHEFTWVAGGAHINEENSDKNELVIVVVGETARADHFSLNGYNRETTPLLANETRLISYPYMVACGTATAISVPCMFSLSTHDEFELDESEYTENSLDLLKGAGINVLWRDNNSSSKGVADRVKYEDYKDPSVNPICEMDECRDEGMLAGLQEYIDHTPGDILIVLHQMGSHGPAYYKRYPAKFEIYTPACHTPELGDCTREEIINAYDNTIRYTDHFLSQVIHLLKANDDEYEATMFYAGDHGESLGENGIYLHGLPYSLAPTEQTHVPFIVWIGKNSDLDYSGTKKLAAWPGSHDSFSQTLLKAFEIDLEEPVTPNIYKLPQLVRMKWEHAS